MEMEAEENLLQHKPYAVHALAPEPRAGKSDKYQGEGYAPGPEIPFVLLLPGADFTPVLVYHETGPIQGTPDNHIPRSAMPESAYGHGEHYVDIGIDVLSEGRQDLVKQDQDDGYRKQNAGPLPGSPDDPCEQEQDRNHNIGKKRPLSVATHWDIEVILKPGGKRDVPALPELSDMRSLIG